MAAPRSAGAEVGAPSAAPRSTSTALNRTVAVVIAGSMMSVLDMTIVNVALPALSEAFHAPLETIQWAATAYTLALAAAIPTAAWAMGRIGAKRTYPTALVLFVLGSLLAACAWDAGSLIAFRAVQGLGGGLIMPVGMAMVMRTADRAVLGRGMGLLGLPHPRRAGGRAGARRLADRHRVLALDLPRQPARRGGGAAACGTASGAAGLAGRGGGAVGLRGCAAVGLPGGGAGGANAPPGCAPVGGHALPSYG